MEMVAVAIKTIVILTLSTGPVFVDLDKRASPAGALQIAQDVAGQDFEAIGAKVYYCRTPSWRHAREKDKAEPLTIAKVSKDWRPTFPKAGYAYALQVMVITTSEFETQGQVAQAIEEARPKARHIIRSWKDIMRPLPLEEKAYGVELRPEEAARFQIAEILLEEGKFAEAVNELESILASTLSEEVKNLARARISTIYVKMGLDEKSEGELKKIIETTTNLELKKRALLTLAGIYRSQKRYDEAMAILRQVIKLTPQDVMKILQFRKEFMPEGFIFPAIDAIDPRGLFTGNPGRLTKFGRALLAREWGVYPKRGYVCFFDKKGEASDDLYYLLLEFEDEQTAATAAGAILDEIKKKPDYYFGVAFAASNVVILVVAERAEYVPAAKWLSITLLEALPPDLQEKATKAVDTQALREATNELAAIKTLRSLMAAEEEFRFADIIDQDSDGAGEYGFFQELCVTIAAPGHAKPISPKFLDPVFGIINASGAASKAGYYFRIFLPGPEPDGPAVGETKGVNSATTNSDAVNQREKCWVCYAWPMDYARTGSRAFVVNQAGKVFATPATVTTYDSTAITPAANAAFVMGTKNISGALADGVGADANTWHPVR